MFFSFLSSTVLLVSLEGEIARVNGECVCSFCLQTWPGDLTSARQDGLGEGTTTTSSQQLPDEGPRGPRWTPGAVCRTVRLADYQFDTVYRPD